MASRWDSLRLYSPAFRDGLPGMPFPAPRTTYPTKDEMGDYLETYTTRFDLPVRSGATVEELTKENGRYVATVGDRRFEADNVVVATGVFKRPYTPEFAGELDPSITQLHSSDYRNLSQLQDGPVLVVGASHSGSDIAYEASASHEVILSGTDTGQIPVPIESRRGRIGFRVLVFVGTHVLNVEHSDRSQDATARPARRRSASPLPEAGPARGGSRARRSREPSASSAAFPYSTTVASSTCAMSSGAPGSGPTSAGFASRSRSARTAIRCSTAASRLVTRALLRGAAVPALVRIDAHRR